MTKKIKHRKKIGNSKLNYRHILIAIIALVIITAASAYTYFILTKPRSIDLSIGFENLCNKNWDMWMEMEQMQNGKKLSKEMCHGCMIGDNHFCIGEEYLSYIKEHTTYMENISLQ